MILPLDIPSAVAGLEVHTLQELASDGTILEIGTDYGFSAIAMAQVANCVHTIDWFRGDSHTGDRDALVTARENVRRAGVEDKVCFLVGAADQLLPHLHDGTYDGAFVDAYHVYDDVIRQGRECARLVRPGGWLAFHDYGSGFPEVEPAVNALAVELGRLRVTVARTLAWIRLP